MQFKFLCGQSGVCTTVSLLCYRESYFTRGLQILLINIREYLLTEGTANHYVLHELSPFGTLSQHRSSLYSCMSVSSSDLSFSDSEDTSIGLAPIPVSPPPLFPPPSAPAPTPAPASIAWLRSILPCARARSLPCARALVPELLLMPLRRWIHPDIYVPR